MREIKNRRDVRDTHLLTLGLITMLWVSAPALASGNTTSSSQGSKTGSQVSANHNHRTSADSSTWLEPIVVDGTKVPMPVALQMIKNALHRPWSSDPNERDVLVCRTPQMLGSHMHTLRCETNDQYFKQQERTQLSLYLSSSHAQSSVTMAVANWTTSHIVNPGALHHLLNKLPAAESSYTLRVKNHGQVDAEYTFKKGRLIKIWKRANNDD